jgi:aspartyl protease family protein
MKVLLTLVIILSLLLTGCSGCSKSGRMARYNNISELPPVTSSVKPNSGTGNTIKMRLESGVYFVPVEINGVALEFIFDTGASDIIISATEALFLYKQGKLKDEDIKGTSQYQLADGTIAEGTVITLRTVRIGTKTLENVKASIVHNMGAPLLIGQSAMSRFGKITIDYTNNEIKFE